MLQTQLEVLSVYLIAACCALVLAAYAWKVRHIAGMASYALFSLCQASWISGTILEISAWNLSIKVFWDNMQWVFAIATALMWLKFSLDYSQTSLSQPTLFWGLILVFPALFLGLTFTNEIHGLLFRNTRIVNATPFTALYYDYEPFVWGVVFILYALLIGGLSLILYKVRRMGQLFQRQALVFVIGVSIPMFVVMGGALYDWQISGQRDVSSLGFVMGNLIMMWGIIRYQLFSVVPLARDIIVENFSDAVIVLDDGNRVIDMNTVARLGANPAVKAPLGQHVTAVFPAWAEIASQYHQAPKQRIEHMVEINGMLTTVDLNISEIRNRKGKRTAKIIVARDVSEAAALREQLKINLEALEVATQRYADLVNNIPGMVFVARQPTDGTTRLDFISDRAAEMLGTPPEEMYTNPRLLETSIAPEHIRTYTYSLRQAIRANKPFFIEFARFINGERRWRNIFASPVKSSDGSPTWQGIEMDVTDRRRAEEALANERASAEQRHLELTVERERRRLMEQIIRGTSHDLRTPISALLTVLYVMNKMFDKLDAQIGQENTEATNLANGLRERTHNLESTTRRLARLVELMLDMARLDSGITLTMNPQDLNAIVRSALSNFQRDTDLKEIEVDFQPGELPRLKMDHEQIAQLVRHLIENAIQYTPPTGNIRIRTSVVDSEVLLYVEDTGIGIPVDDLPHVFERFYRGDKARSANTGGGGLGLAIAARVAELHGGRITAESILGTGSTFRVFLPLNGRSKN